MVIAMAKEGPFRFFWPKFPLAYWDVSFVLSSKCVHILTCKTEELSFQACFHFKLVMSGHKVDIFIYLQCPHGSRDFAVDGIMQERKWGRRWTVNTKCLWQLIFGLPVNLTNPLLQFQVQEVADYIQELPGCTDYAEEFRSQEIDGQALLLLKEDHLMTAMNIKLGPALKICAKINSLREEQ